MIFYFSATGNSKRVAEYLAEATNETLVAIPDALRNRRFTYETSSNEAIGFIAPVFYFGLPSIVADFIEQISITCNDSKLPSYVYSVHTFGTFTGASSVFMAKALASRGLTLTASFSVQCPDTWTPMFDLSDPNKIEQQLTRAEKQLEAVSKQIKQRQQGNHAANRVPVIAARIYYATYSSKRETKHLSANEACIGCGKCAEKCPVGAIAMQDAPSGKRTDRRPVWTKDRCAMCLGCLHRCPTFAIQYGDGKATSKHGQYTNPYTRV